MIEAVQQLVEPFLTALDRVLGERYSAVLYGSAARGDWHPERSDINVLLVADSLDPTVLRGLGPVLAALPREWRSPPLLFTQEEWLGAADVFPIELTDMRLVRQVLRGADLLEGMQPSPTQLRAALERELRTKLVRLRQGYALRAADSHELGVFVSATLSTVLVLARATLVLLGRPVPHEPAALVRAFAEVTGGPAAPLVAITGHRDEAVWACSAEEFEGYLAAIATAATYIDSYLPGAS